MGDMETERISARRKRGPIPGPERIRTTVYIEPALVDWAKRKPRGLSEYVRQLLQEAKDREGEDLPE